jgi:hypothetical protein
MFEVLGIVFGVSWFLFSVCWNSFSGACAAKAIIPGFEIVDDD